MQFDYQKIKTFRFVSYTWDASILVASFNYAFDETHYFTETITFPGAFSPETDAQRQALELCLQNLFLVAGVSYYKAAVPAKLIVEPFCLSISQAAFFEKLYLHGLGEFAFKNNLDLRGKINFPSEQNKQVHPSDYQLPAKTAVPVGGGKDSVVTLDALLNAKKDCVVISVGNPPAIQKVASKAPVPHIIIKRQLSSHLFELNQQGALNGHIPISAVNAFIMATAAVLHGFSMIAMSNERSASVGNLVKDGFEINHQFSKGFEFEQDFNSYFQKHVLTGLKYFSFLRPLSELKIAELFSKAKNYHDVFTSCNAAFKINEQQRVERWCLNCDKCRFVFLSLAPFFPKPQLLAIFGKNLLNDEKQIKGYDELLGVSGHKPFECVGEEEECKAAFLLLIQKTEWQDDLMVKRFRETVLPKLSEPESLISNAMSFSPEHLLPADFEEILHAYSRS